MHNQHTEQDIKEFMAQVKQFHSVTTNNHSVSIKFEYSDFLKWIELSKLDDLINVVTMKE